MIKDRCEHSVHARAVSYSVEEIKINEVIQKRYRPHVIIGHGRIKNDSCITVYDSYRKIVIGIFKRLGRRDQTSHEIRES